MLAWSMGSFTAFVVAVKGRALKASGLVISGAAVSLSLLSRTEVNQ